MTPALGGAFRWDGEHIAITLPGAEVRFTTRRGGVSAGPYAALNLGPWTGDDPAAVAANRERLRTRAGLRALASARQVHATRVARVDVAPAVPDDPRAAPDADGQATALRGVGCLVLTADCLPVAIASAGAVAMVHAGWRGLAGGVLEAGAAAVRELGGGDGELQAAIGPGAGPCCYEVGEEVHAAFAGEDVRAGARNLDLKRAAAARLRAAGVAEVHDIGLCTMCGDPELFFSHRRDRGTTGRQGGLAWRS